MADKDVVSEIVTKFFLNTCRVRPELRKHAVQAVLHSAWIAARHLDSGESEFIPLITGSMAEFYIEPMLPHIGDVDVMFHYSSQLAIPRGHPPPAQLPDEFSNYHVQVYEIVDSHEPGFVYLEFRYLLTEGSEDNKYNSADFGNGVYVLNSFTTWEAKCVIEKHGPAVNADMGDVSLLPVDSVPCVRCLSWPSQAADWPTRHTNYNWPDPATVSHVASNGCDLVGIAHRQCRQHEWMGNFQWRLSFSRAEIVLINSWMPVQQIVYHMLRMFVKNELLGNSSDNCEAPMLSNYHIKTLMMWACELKSSSFWTNDVNLVRICVELLHTLSVWLADARCKHYFINNCNLIDKSLGVIASQLMSIDEAQLSKWFVNNYIRKCSLLSPENITSLFRDISTNTKLHNAVSEMVRWRPCIALQDACLELVSAEYRISREEYYYSVNVRSSVCWISELPKIYTGIPHYFSAVTFLCVAYKMSRIGVTDELMDVLSTAVGQLIKRRHRSQYTSEISLSKATKLMKVVANSSHSTMQLIQIELSKAYLYTALRCHDSDSDSIYCLANIYLAVLYYTTGQYQTAINHCTLVTRSQDHSQCSSHVVQGELLPKIDDDVDNILGLTVFYQHVLSDTLNRQQQRQYVSVFTTEIFAYHLHCRLLSVTQCCQATQTSLFNVRQLCAKCISEMHELFIGDVLVFKSFNSALQQCVSDKPEWSKCGQSVVNETELSTTHLIELLQQSAVERLTTYRQLVAEDFGSVVTTATTDFEALYAYKHGDYQRCLQLSTQNVHTLLYGFCWLSVSTSEAFLQLLDDDIVSLTALTLIVNPKCRDYSCNACISQLTLSLYLMTQCQLKLRHSVTSLAQTLDYIRVAWRRHLSSRLLDQLTLRLAECKATTYLRMTLNS